MSYLLEARTQILLALPVSLSLFLRKSVDICALVFVGHLPSNAEHYLSAAGMASVTANVTGNSMLIGLAGALTTLCSQAHGSGDKEALCLALQRSFLILPLLVSLPVSVLWVFSASVLEFFGQEQALAQDSRGTYGNHSYRTAISTNVVHKP
jgi:MATE family multidrug resistance protein